MILIYSYVNLNALISLSLERTVQVSCLSYYNLNLYDLNFNLLNTLPPKSSIIIYDINNSLKYIFRISDLINIINSSLCYMENFICIINDIKTIESKLLDG